MALIKRYYVDNETVITASNLNKIQDSIINAENQIIGFDKNNRIIDVEFIDLIDNVGVYRVGGKQIYLSEIDETTGGLNIIRLGAEGYQVVVTGKHGHGEGYKTEVTGANGHGEGKFTKSIGDNSHAENYNTQALGKNSHTQGNSTITSYENTDVIGKFNKDIEGMAHIIGNGTSDADRSNAHTVDWEGNAWYQGKIKVGGTGYDSDNAEEIPSKSDVQNMINSSVNKVVTDVDKIPSIKYTEQNLTDVQKAQARENIGAGTSSFSGSYNDLTDKPEDFSAITIEEIDAICNSNIYSSQEVVV